jgi:hypothetical protein
MASKNEKAKTEAVETTAVEAVETPTPAPKREITNDTQVQVMNNTSGKLIYVSPRSHVTWVWEKYGDTDYMTVQELLTMKASHARFFNDQWILVLDDDVVAHLKLERFFEKALSPEELEMYFYLPIDEMESILRRSSPSQQSLIATKAREKYEAGEFTDIYKIKMIEKALDVMIEVGDDEE